MGGKVSYTKLPIVVLQNATLEYRLLGPSDTPPTPAVDYTVDPEPIEVAGIPGKFWLEYKITIP